MQKNHLILVLIISLVLNLLLGVSLVLLISKAGTPAEEAAMPMDVTETSAASTTLPATEPTVSEPAVTVPPPTLPPATQSIATEPPVTQAPTQPPADYIGALYTRQELEKLDNTLIPYGPGTAKNGEPAPYAGSAQEKYGKYGGHFIESDTGVIYLTFDCGYEYFVDGQPLTGLILDTLKEKDTKAVFFVTMSYVKSNPDLIQRMIDEGHAVGNHSVDHHSMPSLTIDQMVSQIMGLHDYMESNFGYKMHLFRPPSGEFSIRSLAVAQSLGYETIHWSFAYADWDTGNQPEPNAALEKILSCHHDGAIYLLHAVSETNTEVLSDVIDGLRDMGYTLKLIP